MDCTMSSEAKLWTTAGILQLSGRRLSYRRGSHMDGVGAWQAAWPSINASNRALIKTYVEDQKLGTDAQSIC